MRRWARTVVWVAVLAASVGACGGGGGGGGGGSGIGAGPVVVAPLPTTPTALPDFDRSAVALGDTRSELSADWTSGAFMQIFVRSYQDSDGDGIGDLRGLISRLDYLRDLGVRGIWLMPIQPSQDRDHGYAVKDYRAVEPQYGSLADLDALLQAAHARGMGVILDHVMNHSAAEHPAFVQSRSSSTNPWRSWYVWQNPAPSGWSVFGGNPWRNDTTGAYYAPFWDQMPDFQLKQPEVVDWHLSHLRFWLNRGVDGFRFDAVGLLVENGPSAWVNQPESRALMARVRQELDRYRQRHLVCEAADDSRGFAQACGSAFAFDLNGALMRLARSSAAAGTTASATTSDAFRADLQAAADYFRSAPAGMATLLANHDAFAGNRVWNQLGGDAAAYRLAAASYLLLPGTPFIYYGEEIGLAASSRLSGDPALRTPMSWTADNLRAGFTTGMPYRALSDNVATQNVQGQLQESGSLLHHYRSLLALRNTRPSIARGSYERAFVQGAVWGYERVLGAERTLVLLNYGPTAATVSVSGLTTGSQLRTLLPQGEAALAAPAGSVSIPIPARSVRVLDLS